MDYKHLNEKLSRFLREADYDSKELRSRRFHEKNSIIDNLIPKLKDEYGDLTIPEFIDVLINKEKQGEDILDESLNESSNYSAYTDSKEATELFLNKLKTKFKHLSVSVDYSERNYNYYIQLTDKTTNKSAFGYVKALFLHKSESVNSWVIRWGDFTKDRPYKNDNPLLDMIEQVFPDSDSNYRYAVSTGNSYDDIYVYTNLTLGKRSDQGRKEAMKYLADEFNKYLAQIDSMIDKKAKEADKEFEELQKVRKEVRANKNAKNTTVKQALSKSAVVKKIQALQNPTPEHLARILAAIGEE